MIRQPTELFLQNLPALHEFKYLVIKRPSMKLLMQASRLCEKSRPVKIREREIMVTGYSVDGSGKRLKDLRVEYIVLK